MIGSLLALAFMLGSTPDVGGANVGERIRISTKLLVLDGTLESVDADGVRLKAGADDVLVPTSEILSVERVRAVVSAALPMPRPPDLSVPAPPPAPVIHFRKPRTMTPASAGLFVDFDGFGASSADGFDRAYYAQAGATRQVIPIRGKFSPGGSLRIGWGRVPGRSDPGSNGWLLAGGAGEGYTRFDDDAESKDNSVFMLDFFGRAGWFVGVTPYAWKFRLTPYAALEGRALAPLFGNTKRSDGTPLPHLNPVLMETGFIRAGVMINEMVDIAAVVPVASHDPFAGVTEWKQPTAFELGICSTFGRKK